MSLQQIPFRVTNLVASVPEGVPVEWQGKELSSGPLFIELDDTSSEHESGGMLDYAAGRAQAVFHVRLRFPELVSILDDLGVDPNLTQPIYGMVRSEGPILDDHSFAFTGQSELRPHRIFSSEDTAASVLPGR